MFYCLVLVLGLFTPLSWAGPFGSGGRGPVETIEEEIKEKKSAEQIALEERLAAIDAENSAISARVIVLRWKGTDTDHRNQALQRNIRNRITRPDARFYPEVDLYQAGRKEPSPTVRHNDQRAVVPGELVDRVMEAVEEIQGIPWSALGAQDWGLRAQELRELVDEIWFVDRPELREPLFLLYAQIGRAAENANQGSPPFYEYISGNSVNYYWYLAATLAHEDPQLMSLLTVVDLNASVNSLKDQLDSGAFAQLPLAFDYEDIDFDPREFTADYRVFINGLEVQISSQEGLYEVPLGRSDVYLRRDDGHSLSDRIDITAFKDKFYFVRQNARKKMGLDFIDQLMAHPNECTPPVDGDILNYLSIYAKLHPSSEIYIAVPKAGSTQPGRIFLWRWDRVTGTLTRVDDNTGGFPVRFVALTGGGINFGGASLVLPGNNDVEGQLEEATPGATPEAADVDALAPSPELTVDGAPVFWELRGHYNRLMVGVGLQYKIGIGGPFGGGEEFPYEDLYQTNHGNVIEDITLLQPDCQTSGQTGCRSEVEASAPVKTRQRRLQRLVYTTVGVMLGKDAAVGFGPRGYLRTGWYNAPHAVEFTAHVGYAAKLPAPGRRDEERSGRVRGLIDADFYGGVLAPYHDSLFIAVSSRDQFGALGKPISTFGFQLGAGLTF